VSPTIDQSPLYRMANPRSIAFFGASNNVGAMGTSLLASVRALGFPGTIYPVHPQEKEVQGLRAYPSVLDLPEIPDLAVLVLPGRIVGQTLEDCGRKGLKQAIVISGGFREVGGEGVRLEQELVQTIRRHGLRLLGPNCIGVANPHQHLNTTFFPHEGEPGFIGLASQSGSFITQMFNPLARLGLGFSTAFSVGNEADLDIVDCMEYLALCPKTKVIGLYIEGIKRGRAFLETARSISPLKPIVALYVGGSETGKRAGFSHTGAMAGPDDLYDGMFRQAGVIRADSITELFDFCWVLGSSPRPRGRRVIILTNSGGPGAAAADACGRAGLELPALSPVTAQKVASFIPGTGSVNNPVDMTFSKNPMALFSEIPQALLEEDKADALLVYFLTSTKIVKRSLRFLGVAEDRLVEESLKVIDEQCEALVNVARKFDKPLIGYTLRPLEEPGIQGFLRRGLPVFPGIRRAVRAVQALAAYSKLRAGSAAELSDGNGSEGSPKKRAI